MVHTSLDMKILESILQIVFADNLLEMVIIITVFGKDRVSRGGWSKKKKVQRHYNRLARMYDSLYGEEQNIKIELILKRMKIGCEDLLLDAGCGTGLLIEHIASRINHFVGLDLAEKALKTAAERSRCLRIKQNVSLIRADVDNLPFRNDIFNEIFALTLLQNVPEPHKTLRELVRVAKSKSQIAVTGLKKHFTKENFNRMISKIGREYFLSETSEAHDFIAIVTVNKVKNKYRQKEGIER